MTTTYDQVAYPIGIFPQTQHVRLAVLATLHGLCPASPRRARVMEVGAGTGMNLIAMAAAWPDAQFTGFDLADSAVQAGKRMIAAAGLRNVELFTGDIRAVADMLEPGGFDYIIAHGVYAWVPGVVREALLALYGRGLAEGGMGFISYNALPGGYVRMIIRDRLRDALDGIDDTEERMTATRALLERMAEEEPGDTPVEGGNAIHGVLREHARSMLERPPAVLFHDELGDVFAPQRVKDVASDADRHGLRLLTDAGRNLNLQGFLPPDMPPCDNEEAALVDNLQALDNSVLRYFRQSVFVRSSARPERRMSAAVTQRIADFWLSGSMPRNEEGAFQHGGEHYEIKDAELATALDRMTAAYPAAIRVEELLQGHQARGGLLRLFAEFCLELRHDPPPFAIALAEKPQVSPLALAGIRLGDGQLLSLSHTILAITQPELRALLSECDGTRTIEDLRKIPHGIPPDEIEMALTTGVRLGMFAPVSSA